MNSQNDNSNNKSKSPPKLNIPPPLPPKLDDCDRPACDDTVSALTAAFQRVQKQQLQQQKQDQSTNSSTSDKNPYKMKSPPNKDVLGKSTWNLLHSMAAWYPDKPSAEDEVFINQFMNSLGRFYPCTYCAHDFRIQLKKNPPRTKSRKDLCVWLCEQHNAVNEKVGKPIFPCDIQTLDRRWRKSE